MKILRLRQVEEMTGLRRSALYERIADGRFVKPIKLGPQAVGWLESEVTAWLEARVSERDAANA
jgi:prophage regulatory protein